jgi:nucleoside-diphosphate-sugar epimerase
LDEGWRVDLLDDFSRGRQDSDLAELLKNERLALRLGDLRDPGLVERLGRGYSEIFHFAAMLGVQNVIDRPYVVLEANVALTFAAIDIARRQTGLRRLVFASTSEVYAGSLEHFGLPIPTPETTPLSLPPLGRPRSSYMLSKLYGEALSLHSSVPVTIIRPHNIYGPRMGLAHVIPQLLERASRTPNGGSMEVYSVEHTRTFCYVEDAVEMILRLAVAHGSEGRAVNVGTEAPEISIGRLAEIVVGVTGKQLAVVPQPPTQGSPARRAPDMSLCAALTGYRSTVEIEDGIARTYRWYAGREFVL